MATVKEVYKQAKDLIFEKPTSTIYDNVVITHLNRLLVELFAENNLARVRNGKEKKDAPQVIPRTNYNNIEIDLEDEYLSNVLPLGLAAQFLIDDDLNKYAIYNTYYNNARVTAQRLVGKKKYDAS